MGGNIVENPFCPSITLSIFKKLKINKFSHLLDANFILAHSTLFNEIYL